MLNENQNIELIISDEIKEIKEIKENEFQTCEKKRRASVEFNGMHHEE
jgi:hypothetical protein